MRLTESACQLSHHAFYLLEWRTNATKTTTYMSGKSAEHKSRNEWCVMSLCETVRKRYQVQLTSFVFFVCPRKISHALKLTELSDVCFSSRFTRSSRSLFVLVTLHRVFCTRTHGAHLLWSCVAHSLIWMNMNGTQVYQINPTAYFARFAFDSQLLARHTKRAKIVSSEVSSVCVCVDSAKTNKDHFSSTYLLLLRSKNSISIARWY